MLKVTVAAVVNALGVVDLEVKKKATLNFNTPICVVVRLELSLT
jgi:hypothetical protein